MRLRLWLLWWAPLPRRPYWLWLFVAGALLFHVLCFYWLKPFAVRTETVPQVKPLVVFVDPASEQSAALAEQSSLLDFEPLFLPTGWNAEPGRISVFNRGKRAEPFVSYGAELSPAMELLPEPFVPVLPQTPQEVLDLDSIAIFSTFGRNAAEPVRLSERQARVQIRGLSPHREERFVDIPANAIAGLEAGGLGVGVFLIEVDVTGSATLPLLRRSTGQDQRDHLWADYLYKQVTDWGLNPGTYELAVGP